MRWRNLSGFAVEFFPLLVVAGSARVFASQTMERLGWDMPYAAFLRGIFSDALIVFFIALALLITGRMWIRYAVGAFWCFIVAGNWEFIITRNANMDFQMAGQAISPVFIVGSILTPSVIFKYSELLFYYSALWCLLRSLTSEWPVGLRRWASVDLRPHVCPHCLDIVLGARLNIPQKAVGLLALFLLIVYAAMPAFSPAIPNWQYYNVIEEGVVSAVARYKNLPKGMNLVSAKDVTDLYKREMDAPLRIQRSAQGGAPPNVLVILVESLSQEQMKRGWLPHLQALAKDGLHYVNFFSHSAVTVNGTYSLMCGDYPTFTHEAWKLNSHASWSFIEHGLWQNRKCLPTVLSEHNFHTVYLQASDLSFANKTDQLPLMGFKESLGGKQLQPNAVGWGLDDKTLFDKVQEKISSLEKDAPQKPWFLTVLTVGTHHPFNKVPTDFMPHVQVRERAYRYADQVVVDFIKNMDRTIRANTLIIISTDESGEYKLNRDKVADMVAYHHGFMLILSPTGERALIEQAYGQKDLQISILDYLGIADDGSFGRSLFRQYDRFSPIIIGTYVQKRLGMIRSHTEMTMCSVTNWACGDYNLANGSLFDIAQDASYSTTPASPERKDMIRKFLDFNDYRLKRKEPGSVN